MQIGNTKLLSLIFCLVYSFCIYGDGGNNLPTIALITTGGTIAGSADPDGGGVVPVLTGEDLIRVIPSLGELAKIEVFEFCNVDSSKMLPETRRQMSVFVDNILKNPGIKGAVITHGTDTIAESAYFLDVTLQSKKPVVLVGAMRDASAISPDGPENIYNAVLQILSEGSEKFGVTVTLNQYIHAAKDVNKASTTNVQAFCSGKKGCLGYIAVGTVYKFRDVPRGKKIPLPKMLQEAVLLKTFSGDDGRFIRYAVDMGVKGIVVESLGSGNVNETVYEAIKYALNHDVIVMISTSISDEGVYPVYGGPGGGVELEKLGVIFTGKLSAVKARILLMLAVSQNLSREEIVQHLAC